MTDPMGILFLNIQSKTFGERQTFFARERMRGRVRAVAGYIYIFFLFAVVVGYSNGR